MNLQPLANIVQHQIDLNFLSAGMSGQGVRAEIYSQLRYIGGLLDVPAIETAEQSNLPRLIRDALNSLVRTVPTEPPRDLPRMLTHLAKMENVVTKLHVILQVLNGRAPSCTTDSLPVALQDLTLIGVELPTLLPSPLHRAKIVAGVSVSPESGKSREWPRLPLTITPISEFEYELMLDSASVDSVPTYLFVAELGLGGYRFMAPIEQSLRDVTWSDELLQRLRVARHEAGDTALPSKISEEWHGLGPAADGNPRKITLDFPPGGDKINLSCTPDRAHSRFFEILVVKTQFGDERGHYVDADFERTVLLWADPGQPVMTAECSAYNIPLVDELPLEVPDVEHAQVTVQVRPATPRDLRYLPSDDMQIVFEMAKHQYLPLMSMGGGRFRFSMSPELAATLHDSATLVLGCSRRADARLSD